MTRSEPIAEQSPSEVRKRFPDGEAGHPTLLGDPHLPLYRRLHLTIAKRIADATWVPGDALPAELDLSRIFGVAPGTVRKAIDELVRDGLVERRHGAGNFVRRSNFDHLMTRFFLFRDESGHVMLPESRIVARELVPASAVLAKKLWLRDGDPLIKITRHRFWDGGIRLLEDIFLPRARFGRILTADAVEIGPLLYPAYERLCGELVCFIEEEISVQPASQADGTLFGVEAGTPVVAVERTARDAVQQPIEWRISRGETSRFRYRVEVR